MKRRSFLASIAGLVAGLIPFRRAAPELVIIEAKPVTIADIAKLDFGWMNDNQIMLLPRGYTIHNLVADEERPGEFKVTARYIPEWTGERYSNPT